MKSFLIFLGVAILAGCVAAPKGVVPVDNFELERYLGTWYEIARLDHPFERGLSQVSATYSRRSDGGLSVINRGFNRQQGTWKEAKGRAYFVGEPTVAQLKVTFFWPFYGGYNVIALDRQGYRYALICGPNRNYLWILARTRQLDQSILQQLISTARLLGFETSGLIFVEH